MSLKTDDFICELSKLIDL